MKSVVAQGSTVAKAIETAWLKAEKPEEFFVRVLQEHSSGFLGFGAQKAKIVLFFKNNHKSDSLFPAVLKQKEYTNYFGNKNLKTPVELNVVDHELNKNVIVHGGQKKKPHDNNQHKNKHAQSSVHAKPVVDAATKQPQLQKIATHNHAQVKLSSVAPHVHQSGKSKPIHNHKPEKMVEHKVAMQVSLQAPDKQVVAQKPLMQTVDKKEDVVTNIAHVLKKVQSQKIAANVSRPSHKASADAARPSSFANPAVAKAMADSRATMDRLADNTAVQLDQVASKKNADKPKVVTPKFESYAEFMDAQVDKAAAKAQIAIDTIEKNVEKVVNNSIDSIVSKIETLHVDVVVNKSAESAVQDIAALAKPMVEKRPFIKMKRRPLTTDNPGVSGITRSSEKKNSENVSEVVDGKTFNKVDTE